MSQTTSSTMSKGPHLCLKNMLSKTDIVQLKALAANKLSIRRISELTGICPQHHQQVPQRDRAGHETQVRTGTMVAGQS